MSFMDLLAYNKLVSSTEWCMSESVTMLCKSLMYIRKSKGPSTEPWGTPMFKARVSDISLLIAVCWVLSARYVLNNFKGIPLTPYCSSLARRMSWSTVSNAFWKSRKTPQAIFPSSAAFQIFSVMLIRAWFVEWWFQLINQSIRILFV